MRFTPPAHYELPESGIHLFFLLEQLERSLIMQALARTEGNKEKASQLLGLKRTTLVMKCQRFGLSQEKV